MSTNDSFNNTFQEEQYTSAPKKPMSGCAIAGIGCGILSLIALIAIVIGAIWVRNNARQIGTDFAVMAMKNGLSQLEIPADQLTRIHARMDEVGQQFKDGKLHAEQMESIFEEINNGPLMSAGMYLFFKRAYLKNSGLSEEELAAAETTAQRFMRGVIDEDISKEESESVLDLISDTDIDGKREFKEQLTDEELRAFLKAASEAADEAGVPAEVPEINLADEFDKAVDEALSNVPPTP